VKQATLPHVRRPEPQGNRGREWEAVLERTHDQYCAHGLGVVFPICNTWEFAGYHFWQTQPANRRAKTAEGGLLVRMKSAPDYVGSLRGRGLVFDAKEFAGASIPYANFDHDGRAKQIRSVYAASRGGALAGYMILEKRTSRVYWVNGDWVMDWSERIRRTPGTPKSINFSKLDFSSPLVSHSVFLLGECDGYRFDYAPKLIPACAADAIHE
jgi:penicillin-binding protein-related factor A (putative recombinase)